MNSVAPNPEPVAIPPAGGNGKLSATESRALVAQLRRAQIYRDYETAFRETTGLPIVLRPVEAMDLPHRGDPA